MPIYLGTYNLVSDAATGYDGGSRRDAGRQHLVRAYGDTRGSGYGFMLFNLDSANAKNVTVGVRNGTRSTYSATLPPWSMTLLELQ